MPTPTARTWQRYGQLRIYVSAGEEEIGWCDPRSGRFQLRQPAMAADFWSAIRAEGQRLLQEGRLSQLTLPAAHAAPGTAAEGVPPDTPWVVRDPRWDDLARNVPGEAANAHAKELRAERPFLVAAAKALGIRTSAEMFAMGARGEREVGRKLNKWAARNGWHVLHAVPVGRAGADIDHVVIASFGVVTINTKATRTGVWVGEYGMTVGGKKVDYLRKSRAEARRARRLLARAVQFDVPFSRPSCSPARAGSRYAGAALRMWLSSGRPVRCADGCENSPPG